LHLTPLPPGVEYDQQQLNALSLENGVLNVSHRMQAELAEVTRKNLGLI
jgi:hypothetical protein